MPLLPALILALAFPASAQLRNERGCTNKQETAIAAAMPLAQKRVADARAAVQAKDPKAAEVGRTLLGGLYAEDPVNAILGLMADRLSGSVAHCSTAADKECGSRAGYVRSDEKGIIHLCPKFFNPSVAAEEPPPVERRVRTLVHESAHMAHPNISEPGGESYCVVFTCEDSCGDGPVDGRSGQHVPGRVADNWSQFAFCAAGNKPDEAETITVSRPRKKK